MNPNITEEYAFSGSKFISNPIVAVTSIFLHAGIIHILSNLLALLFFGIAVEKELGSWKMLAIFMIGGFVGEAFSLFIYPMDVLSIGASGAIFALVGAGMLIKPFDVSFYPFIIPLPLAFIGAIYIIYNIIGFYSGPSNISYAAHFGGLIVGLIVGLKHENGRKGVVIVSIMFILITLIPFISSYIFS